MIPQYTTAYIESDGTYHFCICTEKMTLLAYAQLHEIGDNLLEVSSPVARSGMGTLLYQNLAKFAGFHNHHIVSDRTGDTRSAAMAKWEILYQSLAESHIRPLPEQYNEDIVEQLGNEDDCVQPILHGYRMPADPAFLAGLKYIDELEHPDTLLELISLGKEWYSDAYEMDSNRFINEKYPYPSDDKPMSLPDKPTISINDITICKGSLEVLLQDMENQAYSQTTGDISTIIDINGHLIIDEGHHRFIERIFMHQPHFRVSLLADERRGGREYDLNRPDTNNIIKLNTQLPFGGLEQITDITRLEKIKAAYFNHLRLPAPPTPQVGPTHNAASEPESLPMSRGTTPTLKIK